MEGFALEKATKAEVVSALGAPRRDTVYTAKRDMQGKDLANPLIINSLDYYFDDRLAQPAVAGIEPSRSAWLEFASDKLIGVTSISSFYQDSTNFDESLVKKLEKGKTTEEEVLRLLGKPAGRGVYPIAKEPSGTRMTYQVFLFDAKTRKGTMKILHVYLSPARIVSDFDLNVTIK